MQEIPQFLRLLLLLLWIAGDGRIEQSGIFTNSRWPRWTVCGAFQWWEIVLVYVTMCNLLSRTIVSCYQQKQ
jgi:hypothetical protein